LSARLTIKKLAVELANVVLSAAFVFPARRFIASLAFGPIGSGTTIHGFVRFFDLRKCRIGSNTTINRWCFIDNRGSVTIGSNVNISHDCRIYTMGHDMKDPHARVFCSEVTIGDDAWLFPGVRIMPGASIGRGAIVYPGSIVTKPVEDFAIVAGSPARRIGSRSPDIQYTASFPVHFSI
jgi:acetyltransferase-like isoleucine patch superfamily enzyme